MQQHKINAFDIGFMILSLVAVINTSVLILMELEPELRQFLIFMDTLICFIFLSYFFLQLFSAGNKSQYFKHHWIDLVASIPLIEPFRFARFLQVIRVIRLIKHTRSVLVPLLRNRVQATLATMIVVMVLLIGTSGLSIYIIEHDVAGSNIRTAEDALWWSLVTISTVGYGDYYPTTTTGRLVSTLLILSGVSLFGVISGYIASFFITPEEKDQLAVQNKRIQQVQSQMEELQSSLNSLHTKLDKLTKESKT